jgi:ubiquinone/menaquinone biosynthesis C-methylase UbiE
MDLNRASGFAIVVLAILMFPFTLQMMQEHDDAVREHERECDAEYRLLVLDTSEPSDPVLCDELEGVKSRMVRHFLGSLLLFVVSAIGGLAMVLPSGDSDPKQPPPSREFR